MPRSKQRRTPVDKRVRRSEYVKWWNKEAAIRELAAAVSLLSVVSPHFEADMREIGIPLFGPDPPEAA
jgi:hypothetical protein